MQVEKRALVAQERMEWGWEPGWKQEQHEGDVYGSLDEGGGRMERSG